MKGVPQPHKSISSNLDFRLKGFFFLLLLFHFLYLDYSSLMQIKQLLVIIQVCTKICWSWLSVCSLLRILHQVFLFLRKESLISSTFPCKSHTQNIILVDFISTPSKLLKLFLECIAQNCTECASWDLNSTEDCKIIRSCISHTAHFLMHLGTWNAFLQDHHADSYLVWNPLEPSYPSLQSFCLVNASSGYINILCLIFLNFICLVWAYCSCSFSHYLNILDSDLLTCVFNPLPAFLQILQVYSFSIFQTVQWKFEQNRMDEKSLKDVTAVPSYSIRKLLKNTFWKKYLTTCV